MTGPGYPPDHIADINSKRDSRPLCALPLHSPPPHPTDNMRLPVPLRSAGPLLWLLSLSAPVLAVGPEEHRSYAENLLLKTLPGNSVYASLPTD